MLFCVRFTVVGVACGLCLRVCYNIDIGTLGAWFVSGRVLGVFSGFDSLAVTVV